VSRLARPILVVEDDPDLSLLLATALELDGQRVITADNGLEAFNLARLHNPSLIVLDLMLPIMSGEEFRSAQLADMTIDSIPVLVVSARHDARSAASRMGAVGCLMKPVDVGAFSALVKRLAPLDRGASES
jgi:DNA-binding response OmpR family regulator